MSQCLSLSACRAIARLAEKAMPFDAELALVVVQEISQELNFNTDVTGDDRRSARFLSRVGADERRAGLARRGIASIITEIDRRVGHLQDAS